MCFMSACVSEEQFSVSAIQQDSLISSLAIDRSQTYGEPEKHKPDRQGGISPLQRAEACCLTQKLGSVSLVNPIDVPLGFAWWRHLRLSEQASPRQAYG
jgi:hypothetical protein